MSRAQLTSTVEQNTGGAVSPYVAGKNRLINGGMDFWARGTSFSSAGYGADRWYFSFGGSITFSQETSVIPSGTTYAAKMLATANSSFGELYQALEAQEVNLLAGQTITVSGYTRATSGYTGNAVIAIQTNTTANTQNGGTWTEVASNSLTPSTSAYNRFSVTYAVPAGTLGLRVRLGNTSTQNSGAAIYFANIQLELGSVATPFSRAGGTLSGELAACQRYYQQLSGVQYNVIGQVAAIETTFAAGTIYFPVAMRTQPTFAKTGTQYLYINGTLYYPTTTLLDSGNTFIILQYTTSGMTRGQSGNVLGLTAFTLQFSSEL